MDELLNGGRGVACRSPDLGREGNMHGLEIRRPKSKLRRGRRSPGSAAVAWRREWGRRPVAGWIRRRASSPLASGAREYTAAVLSALDREMSYMSAGIGSAQGRAAWESGGGGATSALASLEDGQGRRWSSRRREGAGAAVVDSVQSSWLGRRGAALWGGAHHGRRQMRAAA